MANATLSVRTILSITPDHGSAIELDNTYTKTVNGSRIFDKTYAIAASTTVRPLDLTETDPAPVFPASAAPTTTEAIKFIYIEVISAETDLSVAVERGNNATTGTPNEVAPPEFIPVGANILIPTDASYTGYTANFGGGTIDRLESLRIRNLSAGTVAVVRLLAFGA